MSPSATSINVLRALFPSSKAQLSKLGAIFQMANSPPRITARTGWCSDPWDKEHHPGGVDKEASRHFLADAATPPRGDARRGIRCFQNETPNHISLSRPRLTRLSTTSATLTWTDVPHEEGNAPAQISSKKISPAHQ